MPQKIDFQPTEEKIDFEPIDFQPSSPTGGHWETKGPHQMWIPNVKPTDAQEGRWFGGYEPLIEQAAQNMRESSLGRAFPTAAKYASGAMEATNKFVLDSLAQPDTLALGLTGLLKNASVLGKGSGGLESQGANTPNIRGLLPSKSVPDYIAGPTGQVAPYAPDIIPGPLGGQVKNPVYERAATTVQRGLRGKFESNRNVYNASGRPVPSEWIEQGASPNLPSAVKPDIPFRVQPDGTFAPVSSVPHSPSVVPTPYAEALRIAKKSKKERDYVREAYDLARGTSAAYDISAPFRQGIGMIGTRNWFKAWVPMFKSLGSEKAFAAVQTRIGELPHIASGLADRAGLDLTNLTKFSRREEILRSTLAEKIPGIRASNRAYTAYLNHLRANTFNDYIDDALAMGLDPTKDIPLAKNIADLVGDLTGRGRLKLDVGIKGNVNIFGRKIPLGRTLNAEMHTKRLTDIFFAPRLMASRVRMLNPSSYVMADPFVRRKMLYGLLRMGAFWMGTATLAKQIGMDVSTDPNSADFGKLKVGDTRYDVAGGHQQYLVLAARMVSGKFTSSSNEKTEEMGSRFGSQTRGSVAERFFSNKLHPMTKFAWDLAFATKHQPIHFADRIMQMYIPMIVGDLMKLYQEDPKLLPSGIIAAAGVGAQSYEKGQTEPVYIAPEHDITFEGGSFLPE